MTEPTVGVVIPSYNQRKYIRECVEAVLAQTHQPVQIVICDDASTDGSQEIIAEYAAKYPDLIEAVLHPQNLGLSRNFNSGLRRIDQEYVSMVSADDYWGPDKLKREVEANGARPTAGWAFSAVVDVDKDGMHIGEDKPDFDTDDDDLTVPMLALKSPVRNPLMKTQILRKTGLFDEAFSVVEDLDWRIRLASAARSVFVPYPTVFYRRHGEGVVSSSSRETYIRGYRQLFRKYELLVGELPSAERKMIRRHWRNRMSLIYRGMIFEERRVNSPFGTLARYARMVIKHPDEWRIKLLLYIVLPLRLSDWIAEFRSGGRVVVPVTGLSPGLGPSMVGKSAVGERETSTDITRSLAISAVICSYRRPDQLAAAIRSLADQTLSNDLYEIIVVDNNSKDETRAIVQRLADEHSASGLRIVYALEKKLGLSHARNTSIMLSNADIIAFLDDDAVASPQWLESLLGGYADSPDVWAVGGPVDPIWDGTQPKWLTPSMYRMLSLLDLGTDARTIAWPERLIGVNCSFRRCAFDEIGMFATSLGRKGRGLLGFEDTEIQQRIQGLKKHVVYVPKALVFHCVPADRMTRRYFAKRAYFTGRSRAILMNMQHGKKATLVQAAKSEFSLIFDVVKLLVPFRVRVKRRGDVTGSPQADGTDKVLSWLPLILTFQVRETRVYFERMQKLVTDIGFLVQAGILAVSFLDPRSNN